MKFKSIFLILLIATFLCESCSVEKAIFNKNQTYFSKNKLTKKEISKEVDFFIHQLEEITLNPYQLANVDKIKHQINTLKSYENISVKDFFREMLILIGHFNIAHLYLSFPYKNYKEEIKNNKLPFKFKIKNNSIVITNKTNKYNIGNEVISINGKRVDSLLNRFYKYIGGTEVWKKTMVEKNLNQYLWLNDIKSPFDVKTTKNTKTIYKDFDKKHQSEKSVIFNFSNKINYQKINDSVGYISFKRMDIYKNLKGYEEFLKTVFSNIQKDKIQKLVIDVRNNPGGNSVIGEKMIDYINDKPFRYSGGKKWKVSKAYKKHFKKMFPFYARPFLKSDTTIKEYFNSPNNTILNKTTNYLIKKPKKNNLRFSGNIYLVVDNGTFSSANIFANAIEDFNMATIIGEKTGEVINDYGEIVAVKFKKSGIYVWIPSAIFIRANGNEADKNPVIPDKHIKQEVLDNMSKDDIVHFINSNYK
ncbi:S41 family peptidase [Polaribacter porphyrae]|uniref:Tail specific protease domain-containing protein n=1 Tax=Polaribacter porphyrae TaxID=1137780 RepID=A0A2S7WNT7_9FLAO|nr:S41 family peptidase [Polaribacter porphyrae]PQJ79275.1 hypothetical protein BTO18_08860 [Polaribacter porphyrae]